MRFILVLSLLFFLLPDPVRADPTQNAATQPDPNTQKTAQGGVTVPGNDGVRLLGKWVENLPSGGKMVTEFTDKTISFTPVDKTGKALRPANASAVVFKKLEKSDKGETISINFQDKDGKSSSGFLAIIKSDDEMVLVFPGMGAHSLTRETAPSAAK